MEIEEIKKIRLLTKMTQEQFAHTIGVTTTTVNRWENGVSKPHLMFIEKLRKLEKKHE